MLSANQIEDIKAQAYAGCGSDLSEVCKVYPLTIKEVIEMGYSNYKTYLSTLLLDEVAISQHIKEKMGEEVPPDKIEPFDYLLSSAEQSDSFLLEVQTMFNTFIKENIVILPEVSLVVIGNPVDRRFISKDNFKEFQEILRIQNGQKVKPPPPKDETPGERKMRLLRERVEAAKQKQSEKDTEGMPFSVFLEIAEVFGINLDKCTVYAFYKLIARHQAKEKWEQDIQMLCAGAEADKLKTKYWGDASLTK